MGILGVINQAKTKFRERQQVLNNSKQERVEKLKLEADRLEKQAQVDDALRKEKARVNELKYRNVRETVNKVRTGLQGAIQKAEARKKMRENNSQRSFGFGNNNSAFAGSGFSGFGQTNQIVKKKARNKPRERIIIIR